MDILLFPNFPQRGKNYSQFCMYVLNLLMLNTEYDDYDGSKCFKRVYKVKNSLYV